MAFTQFPSSCFRTTPIPTFSLPIRASSRLCLPTTHSLNPTGFRNWVQDFRVKSLNWVFSGAIALTLSVTGNLLMQKELNYEAMVLGVGLAEAKVGVNKPELSAYSCKMELNYEAMVLGVGLAEAKVGVNKPELLPREFTPVIDVAGFLSDGQPIAEKTKRKEKEQAKALMWNQIQLMANNATAFYERQINTNDGLLNPRRKGYWLQVERLAIKDFWQVDDRTIVFVADPTFGNILNFNVGATVDLDIPRNFWSRLTGKYRNMFYWKEKGEDASIEAAVMAISNCLREPVGPSNCSEVK
ncbi:Thylakoid lumenal 15.0 kDa protein 2 [Hibiscus syriacus]|uniref:Thylakoid lumenal 15.0 kDa protein 2 n=1 Tax=Hibiscus syriacus TaxID=106335 RepID=A0A6A2Y8P7_HIBSY|nr:Thylakoid lumenal 15.0 kDa protein 2 [Hibiscus syriacus]